MSTDVIESSYWSSDLKVPLLYSDHFPSLALTLHRLFDYFTFSSLLSFLTTSIFKQEKRMSVGRCSTSRNRAVIQEIRFRKNKNIFQMIATKILWLTVFEYQNEKIKNVPTKKKNRLCFLPFMKNIPNEHAEPLKPFVENVYLTHDQVE